MKINHFIKILVLLLIAAGPYAYPQSSQQKHFSDEEYLLAKMKEFNLAVPECLFRYCYNTEIHASGLDESFELDHGIMKLARVKHKQLNNSPFFDISLILQPNKVRAYQTKKKVYKADVGQLITFDADDGTAVNCTYFDRNSDTLVVIGGGFTNEREKMAPFTHIFAEYDVLFFDYRGHGIRTTKLLDPTTWNLNILNHLFGVNPSISRLGLEEEKDVAAAINGMKGLKAYKQVVGVGICYSAMIFIKAASMYPDLFDAIIADGTWFSLKNFTDNLTHDLKRLCSPQRGGWQNFWLTSRKWGRDLIKNLSESIFGLKFESIAVLDYLPNVPKDLKIMYFHGKNDIVISRSEFERIWSATPCDYKVAVITSNPHVWNHLKQKEQYKFLCDLFINNPQEEFLACLKDKEYLLEHEARRVKRALATKI